MGSTLHCLLFILYLRSTGARGKKYLSYWVIRAKKRLFQIVLSPSMLKGMPMSLSVKTAPQTIIAWRTVCMSCKAGQGHGFAFRRQRSFLSAQKIMVNISKLVDLVKWISVFTSLTKQDLAFDNFKVNSYIMFKEFLRNDKCCQFYLYKAKSRQKCLDYGTYCIFLYPNILEGWFQNIKIM